MGSVQCNYMGICYTVSLNPIKHTEMWSYYPGKQENPGSDVGSRKSKQVYGLLGHDDM